MVLLLLVVVGLLLVCVGSVFVVAAVVAAAFTKTYGWLVLCNFNGRGGGCRTRV